MIERLRLDQLRVLVAVAEEGGFSAAGRRLGRAQSAISQIVATLEETQGVTLFDRSGYRPALTEIGRSLVAQARVVLAGAARFEALASGAREGLEAELAVAIDPLAPSAPLIKGLSALREAYPALPISFSTEGLGGALRRLRAGDAALAVCLLLPTPPEDVLAVPLTRVTLRPVAAADHPLAELERPLTKSDLAAHVQLVLSDPVDPDGASYGVASATAWRFVELSLRLDFLRAGFGWCRAPEPFVEADIARGDLVALDILDDDAPNEDLTIYAAHRRDTGLGPAGRLLLAALKGPSRDRAVSPEGVS